VVDEGDVDAASGQIRVRIRALCFAATNSFPGLLCTYSFGPNRHDGFDPASVTIAYATGGEGGEPVAWHALIKISIGCG
jgi:hypothetical protein